MSALLPTIERWERKGYQWKYLFNPVLKPFAIPAQGEVQIPSDKFIYRFKEGILQHFQAGFDHPLCGIRFKADPSFDSGNVFIVSSVALGMVAPDPLIYAKMPPDTPNGVCTIRIESAWKIENWLELYIINTDSVPHTCIAYGYIIVTSDLKPKTS
jgi:hypothetical protein